ncbi:citrulline utilization hydrolase CtlX [Aquiflexum gelatinilyticum]|uniref:Arginine deiminase-related protein n=1 Tax=Aquiflexum gelatinilyticum TaxID=2961943 RepID=A0A9X2SXQ4_9BACT|nr:arginine deiminase-related protein [Aquiflexum gelatinilyticum]MCR9014014.1 arginine deiminase-related protein [Aquiflexum gelatinilyticum]
MTNQTTSHILMVRPANFGFNAETAENNFYQQKDDRNSTEINTLARQEFDAFVGLLEEKGIDVLVVEDTDLPKKTDAVFPNNWFSTHQDGRLVLYPMFSPTRRLERRKDIIEILIKKGFRISEIVDLTFFEQDNQFLEGTGSLILDRINKVAYACRSQRTHQIPLGYFGKLMGFEIVDFDSTQVINGAVSPIYHTNVMMHIGTEISVVCLDSIPLASEKLKVQQYLEKTGKKMIPITAKQKFQFAGNMLEIRNNKGDKFTVMSDSAFQSLGDVQINTIRRYSEIIIPKIPTIEKIGGGSVRCMMAEIFLPLM